MDMRGGFMMRPRDRGPMMRPGFPPMRGRGPPMMDGLRLLPPRPPLMRGAPPPFVRRPGLPPGRPRVMAPVMLPRPPIPPLGALGPPGPRGMLPPPRPMMGPPRPLPPDMVDGFMPNIPMNSYCKDGNVVPTKMNQNQDIDSHTGDRDARNNRIIRNNQTVMQQGASGMKKNRKDIKNRRVPQPTPVVQPSQIPQVPLQTPIQSQHHPVQNVHSNMHQLTPGPAALPPPQNNMHMKQPPTPKHVPPMQSQYVPSQSVPTPHQNPIRGGSMPPRRGGAHMGNRGNAPMNYQPNMPNQMPPRPNTMMNGPQPVAPYSNPPPQSYQVPPPQVPMKRPAPPPVNQTHQPIIPQPKRVRYETPAPTNGYAAPYQQYPPQQQQQPPPQQQQQQPTYTMNYEMPPPATVPTQQPTDMYGNMAAPNNTNIVPTQNYTATDYGNYQMAPATHTYNTNGNTQYSNQSYGTSETYTNSYPASNYDTGADYSSTPAQSMQPATDPYTGYAKPLPTVDSYGYSNSSYTVQPTYDEYSTSYTDSSGYAQQMPDQSYSHQQVNTYPSYTY